MSDILLVRHPVVVAAAGRGGVHRFRVAALDTPARPERRDPGDFVEAACYDDGMRDTFPVPVHAHEGALWREAPFGADELPAVLSRAPWDGPFPTGLPAMVGTPLSASLASGAGPVALRPGEADAERAREDLSAFLSSTLRLVESRVMVRCRGPVAVHQSTHMAPRYGVVLHGGRRTVTPGVAPAHLIAPRPDRVREFWNFEKWVHVNRLDLRVSDKDLHSDAGLEWNGLRKVDPALFGEPEIEAIANAGPLMALHALPPEALALDAVREAARRLAPWARVGATGGVRGYEREAAALAVIGIADAALAWNGPLGVPPPLHKVADYARKIALPRLRADPSPPEEEDAAALAGLRI